ncbi:armadillo-type protein [Ephemerocybe angulata]|uniref:Armadillo-type protein n=1 Tax=Ephemerocybe angulata TaxID=980116 RepID=A0A8H6MEY7_9AGAR|nr:armadillo-type protein [Tulosesus angulatus]
MPFDVTERMPEGTPIADREREIGRLKAINLENEQRIATLETRLQKERVESVLWRTRAREHRLAAEAAEETVKKLRAQYEGVSLGQTPVGKRGRNEFIPGEIAALVGKEIKRPITAIHAHPVKNRRDTISNTGDEAMGLSPNLSNQENAREGGVLVAEIPDDLAHEVNRSLDQLSPDKFDAIVDQMIAWGNKSADEKDGATLQLLANLGYEKAINSEPALSGLYAKLFLQITNRINPAVQRPLTGGQIFRHHLSTRCQEEFKRGWTVSSVDNGDDAAVSKRRRGLGAARLMGELFKHQVLPKPILLECLNKWISDTEIPAEEDLESLCILLTIVGAILDSTSGRGYMDACLRYIRQLSVNPRINSRVQLLLQGVVKLRDGGWDLQSDAAPVAAGSHAQEFSSASNRVINSSLEASSSFSPRPKIVLKDQSGKVVSLSSLVAKVKRPTGTSTSGNGIHQRDGSSTSAPKRATIRMESEHQRAKRLSKKDHRNNKGGNAER